MPGPVEEFTAGLRRLGANPEQRGGIIVYQVEPVGGRFAGEAVPTAVETSEVAGWPIVPPHWIHLSASVVFARTNSQPSPLSGWLRHSRQVSGWGGDPDPTQGWLAHVRGIVGEAR